MDDRVRELLEQQAAWQRAQAALPWEEKLRRSLIMREAQRSMLKASRPQSPERDRR